VTLTPSSGSLAAGASQDVAVSVTSADLTTGDYTATLTVSGFAKNSPQTVDVSLEVRLVATTDDLLRALAGEGTLSAGQVRYLDALGNGNGRFDLGDFLAWLESQAPSAGPGRVRP
jgi:hypothetical protein